MSEMKETVSKYNKLLSGKEEYLVCAKDEGMYDEVSDYYSQMLQAYRDYSNSLFDAATAAMNAKDAYKPKADPYIMGGLAQGIGGVGAGIYAATETAIKNGNIEADRRYYSQQSSQKQREAAGSGYNFSYIVDYAYRKIMSLPNIDKAEKDITKRKNIEALISYKTLQVKNRYNKIHEIENTNGMSRGKVITMRILASILLLGSTYALFLFTYLAITEEVAGMFLFGLSLEIFTGLLCWFLFRLTVSFSKEKLKAEKEKIEKELETHQKELSEYTLELQAYKFDLKTKSYK